MIDLKDFSFKYGNGLPLFKDQNLTIQKEQVTVLTGGNGSGKTTFCRLIIGLLNDYSGSFKINGTEQTKLSTLTISDLITYIKQEPAANLVSALPGEDLDIWLHKFLLKSSSNEKTINEALRYFDLEEQAETPVWELSSGQLKRIGLAALLLNKEKYWLLDEPTSGLDNQLINRLIDLIKEQKELSNGMLIISHRYKKFIDVADRILEIQDNKILELK